MLISVEATFSEEDLLEVRVAALLEEEAEREVSEEGAAVADEARAKAAASTAV